MKAKEGSLLVKRLPGVPETETDTETDRDEVDEDSRFDYALIQLGCKIMWRSFLHVDEEGMGRVGSSRWRVALRRGGCHERRTGWGVVNKGRWMNGRVGRVG